MAAGTNPAKGNPAQNQGLSLQDVALAWDTLDEALARGLSSCTHQGATQRKSPCSGKGRSFLQNPGLKGEFWGRLFTERPGKEASDGKALCPLGSAACRTPVSVGLLTALKVQRLGIHCHFPGLRGRFLIYFMFIFCAGKRSPNRHFLQTGTFPAQVTL